jgi:hypothetical protein
VTFSDKWRGFFGAMWRPCPEPTVCGRVAE